MNGLCKVGSTDLYDPYVIPLILLVMFCVHCGNSIIQNANFCTQCGKQIKNTGLLPNSKKEAQEFKQNNWLFSLGVSIVALTKIIGFALHVWTVWLAFESSGLIVAFFTFAFPIFAQVYWFLSIGSHFGFLNNLYCLTVIGYVGLLFFTFLVLATYSDKDN